MKDIIGYEGLYAVNENGQVWAYEKMIKVGSNGGYRKQNGKWLKQYKFNNRTNHLRVYLNKNNKQTPFLGHRLVALAYLNNSENKPVVNHLDGNPQNNHVSNLEWCSLQENSIHAYKLGLWKPAYQKGESNSQSKLTVETVSSIRNEYIQVKNCSALARKYQLNPKTVNNIINRKSWNHI